MAMVSISSISPITSKYTGHSTLCLTIGNYTRKEENFPLYCKTHFQSEHAVGFELLDLIRAKAQVFAQDEFVVLSD